jgi:hypothetical protein
MPWSSLLGRRSDPSDASTAYNPRAASAGNVGLTDMALAAGGVADPRVTRWVGYGLAGASLALAMYDMIRPSVLAATFLLTLPLAVLALVIGSPTSFETRSWRWRGRAINGFLVMPFVAMIFPNINHAQIDPLAPLIPAAIAAVVLAPLAWLARSRPGLASPWMLFLMLIGCAAVYGYCGTALVDIQFDTSAGTVIPVQVLGKHETHGRSSAYYIDLPPWGPRTQANAVQVSGATSRALNTGDTACIVLHPGVLTLAWFTADVCAQPTAARS